MRKKDIIRSLVKRFPDLPPFLITQMTNRLFAKIMTTLKEGRRVEIRGFGTFFCSERRARDLHNPRTREVTHLPAQRVPRFKAGRALSKYANEVKR